MKAKELAIVGGGQMGRALLGGMIAAGVVDPQKVCLVEPSASSREWWRRQHEQVEFAELADALALSDTVLIAVKPNIVPELLASAASGWQGKRVVSVAAGVSLRKLCKGVGHQRVIRVMPNTPSLVRQGASAFCCAAEVTEVDRDWILRVLQCVGMAIEVDESQMDAVTGLSGSGPAYVCMVIEALADGGVLAGLPRATALQLATQTVLGTAAMIRETGRHPAELKDAVASPGGTTIAAIAVLEQNGLRGSLVQAVAAAAQRSRQLGGDE
jgi:pyrroline-5-carboxylate reductase